MYSYLVRLCSADGAPTLLVEADPLLTRLRATDDNGNEVRIIGHLFTKASDSGAATVVQSLTSQQRHKIFESKGRVLIDEYWGAYIAVIRLGAVQEFRIVRDPSGVIPCYFSTAGDTICFSSNVERAAAIHPTLTLNERFLQTTLIYNRVITDETIAVEVETLHPGQAAVVDFSSSISRTWYWHPAYFTRNRKAFDGLAASQAIRGAVEHTLAEQASLASRLLVMLSGGFDSSTILGALARRATYSQVEGFNFRTELSPDSDERRYSRLMSEWSGATIVEASVAPDAVNLLDPNTFRPMARPFLSIMSSSIWATADQYARERGLSAIWSGDGGDQLFYSFRSAAIFNDYLGVRAPKPPALSVLRDTARLCRRSVSSLLCEATRIGLRDPLAYFYDKILENEGGMVVEEVKAGLSYRQFLPPALSTGPTVPPGKIPQVAGLANTTINYVPLQRRQIKEWRPLVCQPLMELCLEIPSYILTRGGIPRGLAREAMTGLIPDDIRTRQSKGTSISFVHGWLSRPETQLLLQEGYLARNGYINRSAVKSAFADTTQFQKRHRLIELLGVELWLQNFAGWRENPRMEAKC